MRPRSVISIRIRSTRQGISEMEITSSDGQHQACRTVEAPTPTIEHAAARVAQHYGLQRAGFADWSNGSCARPEGSDPIGPEPSTSVRRAMGSPGLARSGPQAGVP